MRVDGLRLAVERSGDGSLRAGGLEALAAAAASGDPAAGPAFCPPCRCTMPRSSTAPHGDGVARAVRLQPVDLQLVPDGAGARVELTADVDGGGSLRVRGALDSLASLGAAALHAPPSTPTQLDAAGALAWLPPGTDGVSAQGRLRVTATLSGRGTRAIEGDASIELSDGALAWSGWQVATPLRLAAHAAGTART